MYYSPYNPPYRSYYEAGPMYSAGYPPVCPDCYNEMHGTWQDNSLRPHKMLYDHGRQPFVTNIESAAENNRTYRTAIWTGKYLQVTVMSINVGEDIGLEVHPSTDQFLRVEEGQGVVQMGDRRDNLYFERRVQEDSAIMVPAGMWHNLINTGNRPLKLYTIYAPPEHPFGTVHQTKYEAMAAE